MNAAQIHLALNHAPLFLSVAGAIILAIGLIKKNDSFQTLSLFILIAAAFFTIPVFLSGEGTEEITEHLPGVNENTIEKHEAWAKISMTIIAVTGAVALFGLLLKRKSGLSRLVLAGSIILSLVSFGAMAKTAHLGGLIRHTELGNGAVTGEIGGEENKEKKGEKTQGLLEKDDDD